MHLVKMRWGGGGIVSVSISETDCIPFTFPLLWTWERQCCQVWTFPSTENHIQRVPADVRKQPLQQAS